MYILITTQNADKLEIKEKEMEFFFQNHLSDKEYSPDVLAIFFHLNCSKYSNSHDPKNFQTGLLTEIKYDRKEFAVEISIQINHFECLEELDNTLIIGFKKGISYIKNLKLKNLKQQDLINDFSKLLEKKGWNHVSLPEEKYFFDDDKNYRIKVPDRMIDKYWVDVEIKKNINPSFQIKPMTDKHFWHIISVKPENIFADDKLKALFNMLVFNRFNLSIIGFEATLQLKLKMLFNNYFAMALCYKYNNYFSEDSFRQFSAMVILNEKKVFDKVMNQDSSVLSELKEFANDEFLYTLTDKVMKELINNPSKWISYSDIVREQFDKQEIHIDFVGKKWSEENIREIYLELFSTTTS